MTLSAFDNFVRDDIDFVAYLRESEHRSRVIPAGRYVDDLWTSFEEEMRSGNSCPGDPMPWDKFNGQFAMRPREVTGWIGWKGHAKSAVLSEVVASLMTRHNRKALLISPEFGGVQLLKRKVRQCAASISPSEMYVRKWCAWANSRLWIFDRQSSLSPDLVLGVVAYAIKELGVNHIVVDSLMKCGIGSDDFGAQKTFVDRLQNLAHQSTDAHVHLVMHARKVEDDTKGPPGIHDVKGASELVDMLENVVTVWLDKRKQQSAKAGDPVDQTKPDVVLTIEAQRNFPAFSFGRYGLFFSKGLRFASSSNASAPPYFAPELVDVQPSFA